MMARYNHRVEGSAQHDGERVSKVRVKGEDPEER